MDAYEARLASTSTLGDRMIRMRGKFSLVSAVWLVATVFFGVPARAERVQIPNEPSQCTVKAWVSLAFDPSVTVYGSPSETASVRGYLPNGSTSDNDRSNVEFEVTEARPGWLHISNSQDRRGLDREGNALPPRSIYRGEGWIRSHLAQIGVQSSLGYVRPDASSQRVLDLKGKWLTDVGQVLGIRACAGEWLLLDFMSEDRDPAMGGRVSSATGTAWFRGICSNQEAICGTRPVDDQP